MPQCEPLKSFSYTELPNATTHIRLLKISPTHNTVKCEISCHMLHAAPPYIAISYTWGDPENEDQIYIGQLTKHVRQNCASALRQACRYRQCGRYWIDAICIDQSNTSEKGKQVALMGEIYSRATCVLACVGDEANDSGHLFEVLRTSRALLIWWHDFLKTRRKGGFDRWDNFKHKAKAEIMSWRMDRRDLFRRGEYERLCRAFIAFFQRPYFSRVWILQELFTAKKAHFCCEHNVAPAKAMHTLAQELYARRFDHELPSQWPVDEEQSHCRAVAELGRSFEANNIVLELACAEKSQKLYVDELMGIVSARSCMDRLDTVFGTLELMQWTSGPLITPDYTLTARRLALTMFAEYKSMMNLGIRSSGQSGFIPLKLFGFAAQLFSNLRLTEEDLGPGSDRRCDPRPGPAESESESEDADFEFIAPHAWRITCESVNDSWTVYLPEVPNHSITGGNEAVSCYSHDQIHDRQKESATILCDAHKACIAKTSINIQSGDWIVYAANPHLSFIVREQISGGYQIVGHASISSHMEEVHILSLHEGHDARFRYQHSDKIHRVFEFFIGYQDLLTIAWKDSLLGDLGKLAGRSLQVELIELVFEDDRFRISGQSWARMMTEEEADVIAAEMKERPNYDQVYRHRVQIPGHQMSRSA